MHGQGCRARRVPGRERRAHRRREQGERLGHLPDHRGAREDVGPRLEREQLEPGPLGLPRPGAQAVRPRHRLRHVRLLHGRDQRRGGREPLRLLPERGRQRDRPGRLGREGRPRLLRLLLLRGEPGHAQRGRDRRRRRLRRAERRDGPGRNLQAPVAPALRLREEGELRQGRSARVRPVPARPRRFTRRGDAVRPADAGADRQGEGRLRGRGRWRGRHTTETTG